jgi:hypothetical protein
MYEQWERCHRPVERPDAQLKALQDRDDRIDDAEAASIEIMRKVHAAEQHLGLSF